MKFPLNNGICLTCVDLHNCSMTVMLPKWEEICEEYEDPKTERPDLFKEFSIDKPIIEDGIITWCPMHYERRRVKAAAYIRSDKELAVGKSHADIIRACPYGTCKAGSVSGFIDNRDQFIDRETAFQIASDVGQLKPEKLRPKNRKYLLSEDIWSSHDNGDWAYNEEQGYFKKEK